MQTIDREWDADELDGVLYDDVVDYYHKYKIAEKYSCRAVYDKDMIQYPQYMVETIKESVWQKDKDLVNVYNELYDKARKAGDTKFGIAHFDKWVEQTIKSLLKKNEVAR